MPNPPIPKIIHQIWIGPKPRPWRLMDTFRQKHPDFEYVLWTEAEIASRGFVLENAEAFDRMGEHWTGKADILRWEILWRYGGIYQDADSVCLEPFDEALLGKAAFAGYENEAERPGLVAVGTMGFPPGHPLCRAAIDWIAANDTRPTPDGKQIWALTGPGLLSRLVETGLYADLCVFPSFLFIPHHYTGARYDGHNKVYCHQIWGTTTDGYETMNRMVIPRDLREPSVWVSVLIVSHNETIVNVRRCLDSLRYQTGHFGMELVWIDDGSAFPAYRALELELERFRKLSRFVRVVHWRNPERMGVAERLLPGSRVGLCTCQTVVRVRSDETLVQSHIRQLLKGV